MKPEVITATIAAVVAIVSAIVSLYGQTRIARLTDRLAQQRAADSRESQTAAIMSKYKDPLLRSAIDLQSRLYNIHQQNFLNHFYGQSQFAKDYAITNTLYVVAEYLGWVEVLRREIQFLDLGDSELNRRLNVLLVNIAQAFSSSKSNNQLGRMFQLYNGEQRAIGEIMTLTRPRDKVSWYDCIGYATFVKSMNDPEFSGWFSKLREDIEMIATMPDANLMRLVEIHSKLIDLLDFLDPHRIIVPPPYRTRIEST